ncbi:MAG: D-aminoacyl-tRNA deacylase [Pseudomonadota bacterium]
MRAVIQRVDQASVTVSGDTIGAIDQGLLILVCAMQGDTDAAANKLADKIGKLRIFKDDQGRMNKSLLDIGGSALVVSQFTLAADTSRGNRPGFSAAAPPDEGKRLYHLFCDALRAQDIPVETGQFGADMDVSLVNQGPVTIWMEI